LLGKAGVVEDEHGVALAGQLQQGADTLIVEIVLVEGDVGKQVVQSLLAGIGEDLSERIAVFVGVFGEQSGEVAVLSTAITFRKCCPSRGLSVLPDRGL
jgi:hypothetical protein